MFYIYLRSINIRKNQSIFHCFKILVRTNLFFVAYNDKNRKLIDVEDKRVIVKVVISPQLYADVGDQWTPFNRKIKVNKWSTQRRNAGSFDSVFRLAKQSVLTALPNLSHHSVKPKWLTILDPKLSQLQQRKSLRPTAYLIFFREYLSKSS